MWGKISYGYDLNGSRIGKTENGYATTTCAWNASNLLGAIKPSGAVLRTRAETRRVVGRYFPQVTERPAAIDLSEPPVAETV